VSDDAVQVNVALPVFPLDAVFETVLLAPSLVTPDNALQALPATDQFTALLVQVVAAVEQLPLE